MIGVQEHHALNGDRAPLAAVPPDQAVRSVGGAAMSGLRHDAAPGEPTWFYHNVGASYADISAVAGIERYSGRVLGATLPGDTVQLAPELAADFPYITEHYRAAGLNTTERVVWDMNSRLPQPGFTSSVFLFSAEDHGREPDPRRVEAVRRFNDKNWFASFAQAHGHPMPATDTYTPGAMPRRTFEGPWFVKGAVAASGTQVIRCDSWDEVQAAASTMDQDYQVQQGVDASTFLNVQYNGTAKGTAQFVATTEQVLHGFAHAGNKYPSSFDPREVTDPAAAQAAEAGLSGLFAYDVAVTLDNPKRPYKFIECNPRPNGSSYFTAVAERLGAAEWSGVNVNTAYSLSQSLERLDAAGLAYNAARAAGAVVVNWGTAGDGKLGVLFVGPQTIQQQQQTATRNLLGAQA